MEYSLMTRETKLGYFLLIALTCLVYANTFKASWHLDDYANIVHNKKLHLEDVSYHSIADTFYASPLQSGKLYRPVACLTFALNWFFGRQDVFGYHLINLLIHCLTALFLAKAIILLFETPMLAGQYEADGAPYWIAIATATLWAIHPIQTQAVAYIVQRMASLAGLFYIIGIFCFLRWRLNTRGTKSILWCLGTVLAFLLALGAKENAILFPIALLLIEVTLFRKRLFDSPRKRLLIATVITGLVLFGIIIILNLSDKGMDAIIGGYGRRSFNHQERLLTEFRIIAHYLYQIFYPNPGNLSIEHDVLLSTGLFQPWTTLPAIIFIFGALWGMLFFLPTAPLLCFGGLFFLLNHSVESSFIPLELVFEHRNYIPSMFIFVGVSAGVYKLLSYYRERNITLWIFLTSVFTLILFFIGMGTYSRNAVWRSEKTLWEDAVRKSPESQRAYHNLAWGYYERIGDTQTALSLYRKAIENHAHRKDSVATAFNNMGNIYYHLGKYKKAIENLKQGIALYPTNPKPHLRLIQSYIALGEWDAAAAEIESVIHVADRIPEIYRLKGDVLLNENRPEEALKWFKRGHTYDGDTLAGIGECLNLLGYYVQSDFFLRSAQALSRNKLFLLLNRLELCLNAGKLNKAKALADLFVRSLPAPKIRDYLKKLVDEKLFYPLDYHRIVPMIETSLRDSVDSNLKSNLKID